MRLRHPGRRLAAGAAAFVILAQGAAMAATTSGTVRVTKPVDATKDDLNPGRLYLAPSLAVDPNNQLHVAAGMTELRTKTCFVMRSADGGQTWVRPEASPAPPSYPFCNTNNRGSYEGQVAFGRGGALYYAFPAWDTQDNGSRGNISLAVSKSTDFGSTWTPVLARDNRGKQNLDSENIRPVGGIAVDSKTGSADTVVVGYVARITNAAAPNAVPNIPTVIISTDGGKHFGAPVNLAPSFFTDQANRDKALTARTTVPAAPNATTTTAVPGSLAAQPNQVANFGGFQPVPVMGKDGTIYAVWPGGTANVTPGIPNGIIVSKSTDKGKTWTSSLAGTFNYNNGSFLQMAWSPGGGPEGTLHVVFPYSDHPEISTYGHIAYVRSTDGGKTWTAPKIIDDDDPNGFFFQGYPNVQVSPDGKRVDVAWYDSRNDPGYRSNDVYYTYSTDDGQSWSKNVRVTDQPIDRRLGVWGPGYDITTPPSMAAANDYSIFGWDDTRNNDKSVIDNNSVGGGAQDFYAADVQYRKIGAGSSKVAKGIVAGVVGLLAVGLILLLASFVAKGQSGDTPTGGGKPAKAPATKAAATKT